MRHIGQLYYDRNCPLCCRAAALLGRGATSTDFSDLSRLPAAVEAVQYVRGGQVWVRSEAIRQVLRDSGWLWMAKLLGAIPQTWRDKVYDWIAARRPCNRGACVL